MEPVLEAICPVCNKKVTTEKKLFTEHKDRRGLVCYGSFTPAQPLNPFKTRRAKFEFANEDGADEIIQHDPIPVEEAPPEFQADGNLDHMYDDDEFLNELRNMN